jgi:hypothetical protein
MNPNLDSAQEVKPSKQLTLIECMGLAGQAPKGSLAGDNLKILEGLAWYHLFGLVLALKKGRCNKALKNLRAAIQEELDKGPLQAYGYDHKGYGAISEAIDEVRGDLGHPNTRRTYRGMVGEYTYLAGYFWYQLQHLTDIPEYRDDAAARAEAEARVLIEASP